MHRTARSNGGKAKMPKSLWLGLSVVGVLFFALHEVLVEDALSLITAHEGVELGQWHILAFLLLDVCHIEVGLAIELIGLELVALLYVHTAIHAGFGRHKVSCCLSADPSCRHIRDFTGWHQIVHILIQIDARLVSIDGHAFLLLYLS